MEGTPKNLLSFLYNVTYDMDLKKRFHADPTGEMGILISQETPSPRSTRWALIATKIQRPKNRLSVSS